HFGLLYSPISADYGKSFHDISHLINNTFIRKEFGLLAGPGNSQQVILTGDTPGLDNPGGVIFTSTDAGVSFKSVQLPFHLAQPITFHFLNPEYLVVISIDGGLWLSLDFGAVWTKVHEGTQSFTWGSGITLFFSFSTKGTVEADRRGELFLKRTKDLGKTFTTVAHSIFSFGYVGGFLFTSVIETLFYSVLDGDEDMIFMHVDNPGGTVGERSELHCNSLKHTHLTHTLSHAHTLVSLSISFSLPLYLRF
uniref:Sortilin N-terminal domain-containing protein n=2 Tax=Hucho hucho TaxID=62062 RepID=A0A4W5M9V3_9TELE